MTPFAIRWKFIGFEAMTAQRPGLDVERIKRMYFEAAGERWGYVLAGWPSSPDQRPLLLPAGPAFTYLEIEAVLLNLPPARAAATGRVPMNSIQRLGGAQPPFPFAAVLQLDLADLGDLLIDRARFFDTVVHEIGHVLGLGTSWELPGLLAPMVRRAADGSVSYIGDAACREFAMARGGTWGDRQPIPLDIEAGTQTPAFHWAEASLERDIMSTQLDSPAAGSGPGQGSNVISRITAAALQDLGYEVRLQAAQDLPG